MQRTFLKTQLENLSSYMEWLKEENNQVKTQHTYVLRQLRKEQGRWFKTGRTRLLIAALEVYLKDLERHNEQLRDLMFKSDLLYAGLVKIDLHQKYGTPDDLKQVINELNNNLCS